METDIFVVASGEVPILTRVRAQDEELAWRIYLTSPDYSNTLQEDFGSSISKLKEYVIDQGVYVYEENTLEVIS